MTCFTVALFTWNFKWNLILIYLKARSILKKKKNSTTWEHDNFLNLTLHWSFYTLVTLVWLSLAKLQGYTLSLNLIIRGVINSINKFKYVHVII